LLQGYYKGTNIPVRLGKPSPNKGKNMSQLNENDLKDENKLKQKIDKFERGV